MSQVCPCNESRYLGQSVEEIVDLLWGMIWLGCYFCCLFVLCCAVLPCRGRMLGSIEASKDGVSRVAWSHLIHRLSIHNRNLQSPEVYSRIKIIVSSSRDSLQLATIFGVQTVRGDQAMMSASENSRQTRFGAGMAWRRYAGNGTQARSRPSRQCFPLGPLLYNPKNLTFGISQTRQPRGGVILFFLTAS